MLNLNVDFTRINTVVFSGGGIKGITYIGFMQALLEHLAFEQITHYIGASAGSIFSLFLVLGYNLDEIKKIIFNYDFSHIYNIQESSLDNILCNLGLSDGYEAKNFFVELLDFKLNVKDLTFKELFEITKIKYTLAVTNFTEQKLEYWNHETKPNMSIIMGVLASSRVPLFFTPLIIDEIVYLDGGMINNFPINYVPVQNIETVIGACLTSKKDINEIGILFKDKTPSFEKVIKYILNLFLFTFNSKISLIDERYLNRTIQLQNRYAHFLDLNISNNLKNTMISLGYEKTKEYCLKHKILNVPINDIPINDIPINDMSINDIPINDMPINDMPINDIPINNIP